MGGGGAIFDVGPFFLQAIVPFSDLTGVQASMTGTPPSGGMVAEAVCAN